MPCKTRAELSWCNTRKTQKVRIAPTIQGQGCHFVAFNNIPQLGAGGLHLYSVRLDFNCLRGGADSESEIGAVALIHDQLDVWLAGFLKPCSLDVHGIVFTNQHGQKFEAPSGVGCYLAAQTCVR